MKVSLAPLRYLATWSGVLPASPDAAPPASSPSPRPEFSDQYSVNIWPRATILAWSMRSRSPVMRAFSCSPSCPLNVTSPRSAPLATATPANTGAATPSWMPAWMGAWIMVRPMPSARASHERLNEVKPACPTVGSPPRTNECSDWRNPRWALRNAKRRKRSGVARNPRVP